jgi:hypothetical protein
VSEAPARVDGHDENARHIIETARPLLLREVSHKVAAKFVVLGHDIEEEGLDIVIQRLRSKEQLGHQAEVLAIDRVLAAVDLEEGVLAVTIDLVAGRVLSWAFELDNG